MSDGQLHAWREWPEPYRAGRAAGPNKHMQLLAIRPPKAAMPLLHMANASISMSGKFFAGRVEQKGYRL
jgi:hypothetical protein